MKRALISVSDKRGIVELAKFLQDEGIEIISTGGTKQALKDAGIKVVPVSSFTGAPEILDGRVKTLHPKIAAGILFRREVEEDREQLDSLDYKPIDLVIVNLYPFSQTVASGKPEADIIENIDIGGPTLIRAAAKNFSSVAVLVDPNQYEGFVKDYKATGGALSPELRRSYAGAVFKMISEYDAAISGYFAGSAAAKTSNESASEFPSEINLHLKKNADLRYGENPHQAAAIYQTIGDTTLSIADAEQLAGKELSYNNYVDLDSVLGMVLDFAEPFACVVKHTNPCGAASAATLIEAYRAAHDADPMSAFGSIIGLNRKVDMATAQLLHETQFVECVLAPDYDADALALLEKKKQRRLLRLPAIGKIAPASRWLRAVHGGFLYQSADRHTVTEAELSIVTKVKPTAEQIKSLLFGFQLIKHIKSNAIAILNGTTMVGMGCGQTSRVDAVENAVKKAGARAKGGVLASDAFFPMPDGVEAAVAAGVKSIIQPGGSKKDDEAIAAADKAGISMVMTGIRHFRH
ncbi:MAG: bifunctional phosphoribosylaminoimidazolecarboxamide formyltransferase/IMP cyclohydrolase [bacterium]|nr:bifunctional phosphoribosylaminoimidazolecarboxamide formyltransferase/IMP cyclohydrolase [bacterium]